MRTSTGEQIYRRCSNTHHHHLMCRSCGHAVEIGGPAVEQWAQTVAEENGFREINHSLEIFGTCSACAAST